MQARCRDMARLLSDPDLTQSWNFLHAAQVKYCDRLSSTCGPAYYIECSDVKASAFLDVPIEPVNHVSQISFLQSRTDSRVEVLRKAIPFIL
jgi:hypothetical protein